jgi:hypothetical protein
LDFLPGFIRRLIEAIQMGNTLANLVDLLDLLQANAITPFVFGGWAEELWSLIPARSHRDIDLLYLADDFRRVDDFLLHCENAKEVGAKHFPHKRAFEWQGVLVELILVQPKGEFSQTCFFSGEVSIVWPEDTFRFSLIVGDRNVPVASPAALIRYRANHAAYQNAYQKFLQGT